MLKYRLSVEDDELDDYEEGTQINVDDDLAYWRSLMTDLPEPLIRNLVLTKLNAVGLRGAAELLPADNRWRRSLPD